MTLTAALPAPAAVRPAEGRVAVTGATALSVAEPSLLPVAERFRADLATYAGVSLPAAVVTSDPSPGSIHLALGSPQGPAPRPTRGLRPTARPSTASATG